MTVILGEDNSVTLLDKPMENQKGNSYFEHGMTDIDLSMYNNKEDLQTEVPLTSLNHENFSEFESKLSLKIENKNNLTSEPNLYCEICGEPFSQENLLIHNIEERNYLKLLHCGLCDVHFAKEEELKKHLMKLHKSHYCKICLIKFNTQRKLRTHNDNCHKPQYDWTCVTCGKNYTKKSSLVQHEKSKHYGTEMTCSHCNYKTRNVYSLKSHMSKHSKCFDFICDICGKGFNLKSVLKQHIASHEGYTCDICLKHYQTRLNFKHHLKTHDSNYNPLDKSYQCDQCGISFNFLQNLKNHVLKHEGSVNKYNCEVCGKTVTSKSSLNSHMRIHTGEKPFPCQYCKRNFSNKKYLSSHVRVHTGEKPYVCSTCNQQFSQRFSLTSHIKNHHPCA